VSAAPVVERANPRALPKQVVLVCAGLLGLGVLAFFYGLATDADTAWRAFHVNYLFLGALSQGALVLVCAFVIIGANWPGPVRRIAEAISAWVPITFVLAVIGLAFGRDHIYPWIGHPPPGKEAWLSVRRLVVTDLGILAVLALLCLAFLRASVRPTLHGAAERAQGFAKTLFSSWSSSWQGDEAERERSARQTRRLAPIICLSFAAGYTVIAFDEVMSLSPTWFSNLFGAFFAWGGFLSGVAATAVLSVLHKDSPGLAGKLDPPRFHDLGKMVFAFSIFWMYLFWSQYLVIWYGNLPEETQFIEARLGPQFLGDTWTFVWSRLNAPYAKLTLATWACCWIIPFWTLLGQRPKRTGWFLATISSIVVFGFWLERNVLVWPSLQPGESWSWLGPIQIGIALGFVGAFGLVFLIYTRVFPTLAVPEGP
jgi:hypothetical protein